MGLILLGALAAGGAIGLVISGLSGSVGVILLVRLAKDRSHVYRYFAVSFVVCLLLLILGVWSYPYSPARPGSDYDIVMKNFFLQALGYCSSLGVATFLAGAATAAMAKKPTTEPKGGGPVPGP